MPKKRLYIVRHGEAEGNAHGFTQTATTPLTKKGQQQAATVAERFRSLSVDIVYASHMDRAQQTASYIAEVKQTEVQTIEHFHEFIKPSSIHNAAHDSAEYIAYMQEERTRYTDPEWRFEDGETFADVLQRVMAGFSFLEASEEEHIVLVSHGRLIRFVTAYITHQKQLSAVAEEQMAETLWVMNTGITVLEYEDEKWKLITFNDLAHFAE